MQSLWSSSRSGHFTPSPSSGKEPRYSFNWLGGWGTEEVLVLPRIELRFVESVTHVFNSTTVEVELDCSGGPR